MKSSFNIPSCTYNIILSKEDLELLTTSSYVGCEISRIPCTSSRGIIDGERRFESLDRKQVENDLRFNLTKQVADIKENEWGVQFLNIMLEKECEK